MLRSILTIGLVVTALLIRAQSIREFNRLCYTVGPNSRFDATSIPLQKTYDKYVFGDAYLLPCERLKTLYGLPIQKILVHVNDDTVTDIRVHLPFDSTLPLRLEAELGPSEVAWMMFEPGKVDTADIIWDKRWFVDDYIIWFRCTRYIPLLGETRDDFMMLVVLPKRKRM